MSLIHKDGIYCLVILMETKRGQQRKLLHILQNHSRKALTTRVLPGQGHELQSFHIHLCCDTSRESSHRPVQLYSLSCNVKDLHQYLTSLAMKCLTSLDMIIFTAIKLKQSRVWKHPLKISVPDSSSHNSAPILKDSMQRDWTELILKDWMPRCRLVNHSCSWSEG